MIEVVLLAMAILGVGGAVVARTSPSRMGSSRQTSSKTNSKTKSRSPTGGKPRSRQGPTLPVQAFTAAGGTTSAKTAPELGADLTGRAARRAGKAGVRAGKATGRATSRGLARGGRWASRRAEARAAPRWQTRAAAGPTPLVTRRRRGHQERDTGTDPEADTDPEASKDTSHRPVQDTTDRGAQPRPAAPDQDGEGAQQKPHQDKEAPVVTMPAAGGSNGADAGGTQQASPPADLNQVISRVSSYEPESVTDLMQFMAGETAGMCGYADALTQVVENCVNSIGLDPQSVQGVTEYSEAVTQAANTMAIAHKQFMAVYQEVMEAVDKGVQMPHNGRWFNAA